MAEIINLNRVRKQANRAQEQKQAQANRLVFGRTRAERQASELEQQRKTHFIEGHRLEDD